MLESHQLVDIVDRLREQGTDDSLVEAKACSKRLSSDIWETVSAFANTHGGTIICGLDEAAGFTPAHGFDFNRIRDQFITGIGDGGQQALVSSVPHYEVTRGLVDGAPVLVIEVEELSLVEKPCYITARGVQSGSFKRVDDKDIRLSPTELYEMQSVLTPSDADGGIVSEATIDDLDGNLVDAIIDNRSSMSPRMLKGAATREQKMERLNIINKLGGVRLAGLLAAGTYPQQYYPKLVIDVAVHPGLDKSEPGAPRFLDRRICDGPIAESIEDALGAIGRNLRKVSYVVGAGRRDEWEIPEEALREAVANAAIHREYSPMFLGQSISVDIYPDRIEIENPGGLWGGKTACNLMNGDSRCRNAKLMSLMGSVPLSRSKGYVAESQGSGIKAMVRDMEARKLEPPRFEVKADAFKVVMSRRMPEDRVLVIEADSDELKDNEAIDSRGRYLRADELRKQVLEVMKDGKVHSARELADILSEPVKRIRYVLPKMVSEGLIEPTASQYSKYRAYIINKKSSSSQK